jgi:hypothetical protein
LKKPLCLAGLILTLLAGPAAWATLAGQLKSSTDYFPYHLGPPTEDIAPYVSTELQFKHKFTRSFRFQFKGMAITNPEAKSAPEKIFGDVPEGFFEAKGGDLKFRFGMDTVNWGVVDVYSPSDVVNSSVFFTPTRTFKRGAPMLELMYDRQVFGLHAIFIPKRFPGLFPSVESRWLPRRLLVNVDYQNTVVRVPDMLQYAYDPAVTINHALDNNAGIKLFSHLGSWDLQITHFEGAAPSPKAVPTTLDVNCPQNSQDCTVNGPIHLEPLTYRVRTSAAGITWAREKWIYRAEAAYQHTFDRGIFAANNLQPWSLSTALAVETNLEVGSSTMNWLAQFYYTKIPAAPDNFLSSTYRLFDRTAVLGTRWAYSDSLNILATVLYDLNDKGVFWMVGFDQKLTESLKWGLAWRDFSARSEGLMKTFDRNDNASMDLTYYF